MHRFFLLTSLLFFLFAQDDFEAYKKQQQEAFQNFLSAQDKEFIGFLKKNWVSVVVEKPKKSYEKPKPLALPVLKKPAPLPKISPLPKKERKTIPAPKKELPPPVAAELKTPKVEKKTAAFTYFGLHAEIPQLSGLPKGKIAQLNNKTISAFWKNFATAEKNQMVSFLKENERLNQLSDYENYTYIFNLSKTIFQSEERQLLATWYFLTKLGYKLKVGYAENKLYLLIPLKEQVYGLSFFRFTNEPYPYYAFTPFKQNSFVKKAVSTYKQNYPEATRSFSFELPQTPRVAEQTKTRTLQFSYNGTPHTITAKYNKNLVDYYTYFPQMNVDIYVRSMPSSPFLRSLIPQLKSIVAGKSETEAANIIIRFVQTAFAYKTDGDHFKREKFLFPDETVHYPFSDCEDRSILYSYLVREILRLDVVALEYPGHIATAINFGNAAQGDYITYKNKKFLVCDPTYMNANIGKAMPDFKHVKPNVREF